MVHGALQLLTWDVTARPQFSVSCVVCDVQDQARMYGGLVALRVLARKYEFKADVSETWLQGTLGHRELYPGNVPGNLDSGLLAAQQELHSKQAPNSV